MPIVPVSEFKGTSLECTPAGPEGDELICRVLQEGDEVVRVNLGTEGEVTVKGDFFLSATSLGFAASPAERIYCRLDSVKKDNGLEIERLSCEVD